MLAYSQILNRKIMSGGSQSECKQSEKCSLSKMRSTDIKYELGNLNNLGEAAGWMWQLHKNGCKRKTYSGAIITLSLLTLHLTLKMFGLEAGCQLSINRYTYTYAKDTNNAHTYAFIPSSIKMI